MKARTKIQSYRALGLTLALAAATTLTGCGETEAEKEARVMEEMKELAEAKSKESRERTNKRLTSKSSSFDNFEFDTSHAKGSAE